MSLPNYVYVVNYGDIEETTPHGVFLTHIDAVKYVMENGCHEFSYDLNSGGCDICRKMISEDEISFVCTDCSDYHLCQGCYTLERTIHDCIPNPDLQELKREITQTGFLQDTDGIYSIHRVVVF